MKNEDIILIAVIGIAAWYFLMKKPAAATVATSPTNPASNIGATISPYISDGQSIYNDFFGNNNTQTNSTSGVAAVPYYDGSGDLVNTDGNTG